MEEVILHFEDCTLKLSWHEEKVPKNMAIRQVYGGALSQDGRVMLKVEDTPRGKEYSLIGGTTEDFDDSTEATLRREFLEEVNTTLKDKVCYLGFQRVEGDHDKPPYAQVRMACLIDEIGEGRPDPDGGETYERLLTTPERAIELLNWRIIGKAIITKAIEVAKTQLGIKTFSDKEEFV